MILSALLLAAPGAVAPPHVEPLRTFTDWIVGCDNLRACEAVALLPEGEEADAYLFLIVTRGGAPDAAARMQVPMPGNPAANEPLTLEVDGDPVATLLSPGGGDGLALPLSGTLLGRLAEGRRATLRDAAGKAVASASLTGLTAALLAMDEAQRRHGTRTALLQPGRASPTTIPAVPALPIVVEPRVGTAPPRGIDAAQAVRLIGPDNASCDTPNRGVAPQAFRLDAGHSLVAVDHPCGNGAYNAYTSLFVIDERGQVAPARMDAPAGFAQAPGNVVVSGGWNAATRRLESFTRGRGLGDCGSRQTFAWDGAMFRLVGQEDMGECRGAMDYIPMWRARVQAGG